MEDCEAAKVDRVFANKGLSEVIIRVRHKLRAWHTR
jgi:hypothetical protein